ncbi:hypothetical protein [Maricaulis sp.]|uniref:hypothetical protein n=1 Tax=Maricaulis sp. TaxID=1486257 RepID=UPI003A8E66D3
MRQNAKPLFLPRNGEAAQPLLRHVTGNSAQARGYDEEFIKKLVLDHPDILPIREIDPTCLNPIPVCEELGTPAGPVDALLITREGVPVLIECKLWSNPQARREVVGQVLDYAKEIRTWSYEDLQRAAGRALKQTGFDLFQLVSTRSNGLGEADFIDSVTANLRAGRCLLLIVGDGIREGVEAIGEYLSGTGSLEYTLGLVELPIYDLPEGLGRIVTPRVIAKTTILGRHVVSLASEGISISDGDVPKEESAKTSAEIARESENFRVWTTMLDRLVLDDQAQARPKPGNGATVTFALPAPRGGSIVRDNWITVYLYRSQSIAGLFVTGTTGSFGGEIMAGLDAQFDEINAELGGKVTRSEPKPGKINIGEQIPLGDLSSPEEIERVTAWLAERVNAYVSVFRPRIEKIARDLD